MALEYPFFQKIARRLVFRSQHPVYDTFELRYVPQKVVFRKFLMTSLRVICGLGTSPFKNPGFAYKWEKSN